MFVSMILMTSIEYGRGNVYNAITDKSNLKSSQENTSLVLGKYYFNRIQTWPFERMFLTGRGSIGPPSELCHQLAIGMKFGTLSKQLIIVGWGNLSKQNSFVCTYILYFVTFFIILFFCVFCLVLCLYFFRIDLKVWNSM